MKNLRYLILIFTLVFVFGCEEDNLPPAFQDATWVTNVRPGDPYVLKEGDAFSFRDLSQGALSHEFVIEEGNKYLHSGFGAKDSLPLFINKDLGLTTTNKDAHVLFLKGGINQVKLRNTFKDSLTYQGEIPIHAFQENGVWVIENVWSIDVFTPLKPAFKVLDKNGVELINISGDDEISIDDIDTWPVVQVEAGDALTYIDLTTEDRPNARTWSNPKGKPGTSTEEEATVGYFSLGTFPAGVFTSVREGDEFPEEKVKKIIPLIVEVIPSSQPFVFNESGGIIQNNDDSITLGLTGEVEPFVGEEGSFTVHVVNAEAGFNQNIAVQSVLINSNDATKIDLVLSEPIYNTDDITVSYTSGNIQSVDTRVLQSFGPIDVKINLGANVIVDKNWAGFENFSTSGNTIRKGDLNGYWVGNKNDAFQYFYRNTDKFASGSASLRYMNPNGIDRDITIQGYDFSKPNGIAAGKYLVSYQVYLEMGNTMKGFYNTTPAGNLTWNLETLPRGEWIEISQEVDVVSNIPSGERYNITVNMADNIGVTGEQIMYFDNLSWIFLNPRL